MPGAFLNSVNERQKIRGANREQKQTQTLRCHVAEEQSLAVDKEKEIDKKKKHFARPEVYFLFEL